MSNLQSAVESENAAWLKFKADKDILIEHLDKREPGWFVTYATPDDLKAYARNCAATDYSHGLWALKQATARWILACASRCTDAGIMRWSPPDAVTEQETKPKP